VLQHVWTCLLCISCICSKNVCCSALQCVAVCCSVLQCVAACCSEFEHVWGVSLVYAVRICVAVRCSALQCVAACCSMLQRAAACCSVLQRVAACLDCVSWMCIHMLTQRTHIYKMQPHHTHSLCIHLHCACVVKPPQTHPLCMEWHHQVVRCADETRLVRAFETLICYRAAKTHRMPYLYWSFSAKEPYN